MRIPYTPAEGPDRLPQAMVEAATEHDWADLPEAVKQVMRAAADTFRVWAANADPIAGEVVPEPPALGAGCHAQHNDGDCTWTGCPQVRDSEPRATGRHCPLDDGKDPYG